MNKVEYSSPYIFYKEKRFFFLKICMAYVLTLPFWTGGSRFERIAPVLPILRKISHFEMILAWMSDIYEFFKPITLFTNSMWKYWPLITKSCAYIAPVYHLHHHLWIRVNKSTYFSLKVKVLAKTMQNSAF